MSLWLDIKYLKQIAWQLDGYKEVRLTPLLSRCRCPLCGDSTKNTKKMRGGFFERGNNIYYKCLNCQSDEAWHLSTFLQNQFPAVYNSYRLESFQEKRELHRVNDTPAVDLAKFRVDVSVAEVKQFNTKFFSDLVLIKDLDKDHPARSYLEGRNLPDIMYSFGYTDTFIKWTASNTDRFTQGEANINDHPRIIIPWYGQTGKIFAYQARSIEGQSPKYYTILLDTDVPKIFGMDRLVGDKRIYVVEGPLDSLFLPNSVAVGSSALTNFDDKEYDDVVYVFDVEPRNEEICKIILKAIRKGKQVFIPPNSYKHKDINEAIEAGMTKEEILSLIEENTFRGLSAELQFSRWVKIHNQQRGKKYTYDRS